MVLSFQKTSEIVYLWSFIGICKFSICGVYSKPQHNPKIPYDSEMTYVQHRTAAKNSALLLDSFPEHVELPIRC